jgi:hypothetical protein
MPQGLRPVKPHTYQKDKLRKYNTKEEFEDSHSAVQSKSN